MNWFGRKPTAQAEAPSPATGFDDFEVRLGDLMRGERATLGKSLLDVQRELHIRAPYIAAIEAGDLSAFEAPSFVAGFVRSYARYLGMDPDWCFAKFCAETGFTVGPDLGRSFAAPKVEQAAPATRDFNPGILGRAQMSAPQEPIWARLNIQAIGSVSVLVVLIAGLGYGGWRVLQEVQRVNLVPADQPPAVLADLDPLSGGAAPRIGDADSPTLRLGQVASSASVQAEGVVRLYRPEALDAPVMVSRDGPIAAIVPAARDAAPVIDTSDAISLALGDVRVTRDGPPLVEVLAVRPSWVRVRSADGTVMFEKILDAGERYAVPATEAPPTLRAGNSGSVYLLVDGAPFGPLAPGAAVVDQIALSAEAVAERFTVADLTGDRDLKTFITVAQAE
ncbi:MAG: helix-turn-helix domain-containing protein [Roseinatronobacter sp.]